jgi:hypothetical protein
MVTVAAGKVGPLLHGPPAKKFDVYSWGVNAGILKVAANGEHVTLEA